MQTVIKNIGSFIYDIAVKENSELLSLTDQSIGFKQMPELAFAYLCGKEIFRHRKVVLGSKDYEWRREESVGSTGPSDLIFQINSNEFKNIVIEFKLDDTYYSYNDDIEKLDKINDPNFIKLFCSFKWVYDNQVKEFGDKLREIFPENVKLIDSKSFRTVINTNRDLFLFTFWQVL